MTILVCKIPSIHLLINMIKAYLICVHSIYMYYVYIIKKILLKLKAYNRYLTLLYAHRVIWKCIFFFVFAGGVDKHSEEILQGYFGA